MDDRIEALMLLRIIAEIAALIERALRAGESGVSKADLDAAFARADLAEDAWERAKEERYESKA